MKISHALVYLLTATAIACGDPAGSASPLSGSPDGGALDEGASTSGEDEGALSGTSKLRGTSTNIVRQAIHVCFAADAPGSVQYRSWVREAVRNQWQYWGPVDFIGWEVCNPSTTGPKLTVRFGHYVGPTYSAGKLQQINLEIDYTQSRPGTGCGYNDPACDLSIVYSNSSLWCRNRPQYCTEGNAVFLFGLALGFDADSLRTTTQTVYSPDHPSNVMADSVLPSVHNGGILSAGEINGLWNVYGAPRGYEFIPVSSPSFPGEASAVAGGTEPNGTVLRVCRAALNGGVHIGSWVNGVCSISWGGGQYFLTDAELLFGTGIAWQAPSLLYSDLYAGMEANGSALSVCRAPYNGSMVVGKRPSSGPWGCYIGHGLQERYVTTGVQLLVRTP